MEEQLPENDKPEVEIKYQDTQIQTEPDKLVDDAFGMVPTVSATPTFTPRKFIDQVRIMTGQWCFYDNVAGAWTCVGADSVYGGRVTNGAAGTPFPSGWSVSNPSTGNYQITHNLGHASYAVVITPLQVVVPNITSIGTTTLNVNFKNLSAADTDSNFMFILTDES